jgi:hypothetical protein
MLSSNKQSIEGGKVDKDSALTSSYQTKTFESVKTNEELG